MNKKEADKKTEEVPLSETISNAHSAGNGALRLSEDGLLDTGETEADAEAHKEQQGNEEEY